MNYNVIITIFSNILTTHNKVKEKRLKSNILSKDYYLL